MSRAAAVLFDLDGTLLDTAPDMVGALNRLRAEEGREPLPFDAVRASVSHGALRLTRVGFPEAEGAEFERLRLRFLQVYAAHLALETTLFPGMAEVLQQFEDEGLPWGVVTNKPAWLTDPLLAQLGLAQRACCIVSGDTVAERKPHPLPLLHAAQVTGVDPRRCVYVGDAERDIVAGRAAGMQTVVAAYGYLGAEDDPAAWAPHGIIHRPEQVTAWLDLQHLEAASPQ
ncbi:MAG TPA: phosphoglycolate phosphatase [Steroidobacteraceae bacterium]